MNKSLKAVTAFFTLSLAVCQLSFSQQKINRQYFEMPEGITESDYLTKTIIVKVKPEFRDYCSAEKINIPEVETILQNAGTTSFRKKYPFSPAPEKEKNERGEKLVDLSLIYEFSYLAEIPEEEVINQLYATNKFKYAELHILDKLTFTPNDPGLSETGSYFLGKINAYNAWNVSQGDTTIVIGITDTGTEISHPDLVNSVKYNYADPINGIDDDSDGYMDNFRGWDLGENDNNPQYNAVAHGIHVAGLAAASVNNNMGMAGVGFKCKFMPIKIADANGNLTQGYEGITYAADHGCQIINCSWGSSFGTQLGQDVINYAVLNKGALVVAGAGNDGQQQDFYPASFDNVISVASTNTIDRKSNFSNYGYNIDVCAPGDQVYSTWELIWGGYLTSSGTSMSAPVVCGAAAIVKSQFPNYTGLQVGEVLKATADNIDFTSGNNAWAGKLGKGRINLFRALTETDAKSVVITNNQITDGNDNAFVVNDTLNFIGTFTNYLSPLSNLVATMSSASPFVEVISTTATIGSMNTLATTSNNTPFRIRILPTAPQNQSVDLKITMTDGTYSTDQYFTIIVNVDYINIAINDVATTITSKGRIGYNGTAQAEGLGFTYLNSNSMLYEAGLMIGVPSRVSNNVRADAGVTDNDFASTWNVHRNLPAIAADFDVEGAFYDNPAGLDQLPVGVNHKAYAWVEDGFRKFVIVEYKITNQGDVTFNDLYAGIFADWDIMDYSLNKASFDSGKRMGYIWSTENDGLWAGIKLLSPGTANCYSIDNINGGSGGIDMFNGYSEAEKYQSLSSSRNDAGGTGTGNDVIHVVSSGPFSILPDSSVIVAFALIAGEDLSDIQASADAAQTKYDVDVPNGVEELISENPILIYPNPAKDELNILFNSAVNGSGAVVKIVNTIGEIVSQSTVKGQKSIVDISSLRAGIYFCHVENGNTLFTRKIVVVK